MDLPNVRTCSKCKKSKSLVASEFKAARDNTFSKVCIECLALTRAKYADNKRDKQLSEDKENQLEAEDASEAEEDASLRGTLTDLTLEVFLDTIASSEDLERFTAFVDVSPILGKDSRATADSLAKSIWEHTKYRFNYHSCYEYTRTPTTRYSYHCAQGETRQHKPKKGKAASGAQRDKDRMDTFKCDGWLHITIPDGSSIALAKYKHESRHVAYWNIDVPTDIQEYIASNLNITSAQLWDEVLRRYPTPAFSRKAVYSIWHEKLSKQWKRDPDEVKSAKKLLEEAASQSGNALYSVQSIPLPDKPGFVALAFSLPEIVRKFGGKIREVSLDSAWNTNGSRFEVYALLGEVYGSGCPLGYLLIQSTEKGEPGSKELYIKELLDHFKMTWKIRPIVTLTDKDWSEINACLATFPDAKHQLCFWHCLRAIKTRLSILRRRPKFYDVKEAKKEFDWIDEKFVPLAQKMDDTPRESYSTQKTLPILTIRFDGARQNLAPEPVKAPPRLVIRLNNIVQAVIPRSLALIPDSNNSADPETLTSPGVEENVDNDETADSEEGDLLDQVNKLGDNDQDAEDGPDWMFDDGEITSKDPDYVFCPALHRKQLLHMFTKHFCQHPAFPERKEGGNWTPEQIRRNAVYDMYTYCKTRNLYEVWGYMWACWYSPKNWKLWARSSTPYVSRLRTTMGVENFWKQLKHNYLHNTFRPRLDHLVWILIYRVTPAYFARSHMLQDEFRLGRSRNLTTFQTYFKKNWRKLLTQEVGETKYITNVEQWTCNCGQQKYDPHHLCKHLVQAVPSPSVRFWSEVRRRRVVPLYQHPEITQKGEDGKPMHEGDYIEPDGAITDGDDHLWSGDKSILEGGGGWEELILKRDQASKARNGTLGKRARQSTNAESSKRARTSDDSTNNIIDLTESSPPPDSSDSTAIVLDSLAPTATGSQPLDYGSDGEQEDQNLKDYTLDLATALERAAEMCRKQAALSHTSGARIWMKSVRDRRIGNDVIEMVTDIRRATETGHTSGTTWALGKNKKERRKVRNTMGFI